MVLDEIVDLLVRNRQSHDDRVFVQACASRLFEDYIQLADMVVRVRVFIYDHV